MISHPLTSYDEALGPRANRYFGDGYKKVSPDLTGLKLTRSTEVGTVYSGTARLDYPADWSQKKHRELVPHVSSVDTIMLAATLCDAALTHTRSLSAAESSRIWVSKASVRAGGQPHEDLEHIPVRAEITASTHDDPAANETSFKFQVGNLVGTLSMVHPSGSDALTSPGADHIASLADIFGPAPHYYLNGVKDHSLTGADIAINTDITGISGKQRVATGREGGYVGAESAHWKSVSIIDAIVGAAQLAQILLYEMDGLDRTNSNTLWMRKIELGTQDPQHRCADEVFEGAAEIRRTSIINRGGQRWRSVDLAIKGFQGVTGHTLLAHQLPE